MTNEEPLETTPAPRASLQPPSDNPSSAAASQEPSPAEAAPAEHGRRELQRDAEAPLEAAPEEAADGPDRSKDRAEPWQAQQRDIEADTPGVAAPEAPPPLIDAAWTQPQPTEVREAPSDQPRGVWLSRLVLVLFVLFVVSAATAFKWWRYDYSQAERELRAMKVHVEGLSAELNSLRGESSALASKEAELAATLGGKDTELTTAVAELREAHKGLGNSITELALRTPGGPDDLALAEVEMLVSMAQQRLDLEHDAATALASMEAADRRLHKLARPDLKAVREQIIHDANELRAVPLPDIPGVSLLLADLIHRVEQLPLLGDLAPSRPLPAEPTQSPAIENWRDLLRAIWADLLNLVSVKRLESKDPMLFDPQFQRLLKQSLKLDLANARLDLLQRDTEGFKASLGLASDTLHRYFDTETPVIASVLEKLEDFRALDLRPSLPDVSGSIRALRDYALEHERLAAPVPSDSPGPDPVQDDSMSNASGEAADLPPPTAPAGEPASPPP